MTVKRIEFLGFIVAGPRGSNKQAYKPAEWPGWTATLDGEYIVFEGEGRRIEVPRSRCIVELGKAPVVAEAVPVKRGPGRPPKVQAEPVS